MTKCFRRAVKSISNMVPYYMIPFLLVIHISSLPNDDFNFEYTFETRLTTKVSLNAQMHDKINKNILIIQFKCRLYEWDEMMCYKGKHEHNPLNAQTLVNISDHYYDTVFQITFNQSGVVDYVINRTNNKTMEFLLNLYRFFGSQLSIGTEKYINNKSSFQSTEQSVIGSCPTDFDITFQTFTSNRTLDRNMFLSLDNYVFEKNEKLRLFKRRHINSCQTTSNYMFGSSYWNKFLPDEVTEKNMTSSESIMMLSKYNFESKTKNIFNLYDRNMNVIGNVAEDIEVVLKSILPPENLVSRVFLNPISAGVIAEQFNK